MCVLLCICVFFYAYVCSFMHMCVLLRICVFFYAYVCSFTHKRDLVLILPADFVSLGIMQRIKCGWVARSVTIRLFSCSCDVIGFN